MSVAYTRRRAPLARDFRAGGSHTWEIGNVFVYPQPSLSLTCRFPASYATTVQVQGPHHGQSHTTRSPGMNAHGLSSSSVTTCSLPWRKRTRITSAEIDSTLAT